MPPVQEISEIVEVRSQESSPLTITPTFPRQFQNNSEGNDNDSTMIPSTAEQCKESINRTKQQAGSFLHNNNNNNNNSIIKNFNNYNNNNNNDDDDDCWNLTSLDWLLDRNLLRRVISNPDSSRAGGLLSSSPTPSDDGRVGKCHSSCKFIIPKVEFLTDQDGFEPLMPEAYHPTRHADCKPPYSFSCLIFMAIENSPEKRLPVKDIYAWIQGNFPFFSRAPSGWKNSVRHNLSLNKCFTKVEKDKGMGIGKGSHWYVDPTYKANLLHALRKTPYQPFHQMQMVSTNHASYGSSLSSQETNQNLKSLFPYVSKKAQGKHSADSNEIDVANALVSLKKSGAHLNKSKQHLQEDGEENYDDGDDWVDEDVDDDEADDDDEETTNAEFVHMLKRKLGQQKVIENFFCTPAVSMDHQYGMSDDRVRDILTTFDCFDDCCSLSSMSEDEDGADNDPNKSAGTDLMNDAEIKQEIKEEPLSDDDMGEIQKQNSILKAGSKLLDKKSLKPGSGKRAGFTVGVRKPSTKASTVERAGTKGKRKLATNNNNNKNEPPNKRASKEFDEEEEQRIREGADALLELATNMINGSATEEAVAKDSSTRDGVTGAESSPELRTKSTRRGRPPAKKKQKPSRRKDDSDDETDDFHVSTSADAKKRVPKDFVPNGLTSASSAPRSFQSKRLQMRYLEQVVNSNDNTNQSKVAKPQKCSTRSRTSGRNNNNNNPQQQDMEVLSIKDWNLNFSSIDLSEINSSDLMKDDGMYDRDGKVLLDQVKEEPAEGLDIKEEVVDDDDDDGHDDDGY